MQIIEIVNRTVKDLWSWKLKGYNIFSFPCIKGNKIAVAVTQSPNTHYQNTIIYEIDLKNYTIRKIISINNFYIINLKLFKDGRLLLTGYSRANEKEIGKVIIVKNKNIIFEKILGDRTTAALISDFNKDGLEDFLISSVKFDSGVRSTIYLFLGTSNSFKVIRVATIPEIVLDAKIINLNGDKVIFVCPHDIYLLNLSNWNLRKVFNVKKGYFIVSLDCVDLNRDGIDEIAAIYTNATKRLFIELKYKSGAFKPVQYYSSNLTCFVIRHLKNNSFIVGTTKGLYVLTASRDS